MAEGVCVQNVGTNNITVIVAFVAVVLIVSVFVLFPNGFGAQSSRKVISVSAIGAAYGSPDQAVIYLYVNGTGSTSRKAVLNLSSTLGVLNNTLMRYTGNNASMVSTEGYSVSRAFNSSSYEAYESLKVTIVDINDTVAALLNISSVPNVYISSVEPGVSSQKAGALRSEAINYAIANATSMADAVSSNVALYNVTINSYYGVYPYPIMLYGAQLDSPQNITANVNSLFYSGKISVEESVDAEFIYK